MLLKKHALINICALLLWIIAMFEAEGITTCSYQIFGSSLPEELSPLKSFVQEYFVLIPCCFTCCYFFLCCNYAFFILLNHMYTRTMCWTFCTAFLVFHIYAMAWVLANFKFLLSCYLNLFYCPQDCILQNFNISINSCCNKLYNTTMYVRY